MMQGFVSDNSSFVLAMSLASAFTLCTNKCK